MQINLNNGSLTIMGISLPQSVHCILEQVNNYFNTGSLYIFELLQNNIIMNIDQQLESFDNLQIIPTRIDLLQQIQVIQPNLTNICFNYSFRMYQTSKWICSDVHNVKIIKILLAIQQFDDSLVNDDAMLVPEKQRALYLYMIDRANKLQPIDNQSFFQLQQQFLFEILGSPYVNLFSYPVLDIEQNWTSFIGLAQDGITLIDQELGLAYLYFPMEYFTCTYFGDKFISIIVKRELLSIQQLISHIVTDNLENQPDINTPLSARIRDFVVNKTKNIDIPLISKLPEEGQEFKNLDKIVQFKVDQSQKFIHDEITVVSPQTENNSLQNVEILNVRETLQIRFKDNNTAQGVFNYITFYQKNNKLTELSKIVRNYRIMSESTLELFKQIYFNNCVKFCVKPSQTLVKKIDNILDSNSQQNFVDFTFNQESLTNLSLKALIQAITTTLDYEPNIGTFCVQSIQRSKKIQIKTSKCSDNQQKHPNYLTRFFRGGQGTPYDPFIQIQPQIRHNLQFQRFALLQNNFQTLQWISELSKLFQTEIIQRQVIVLEISDNLVLNKGLIVLADSIKNFKHLKALHLNKLQIKQTGISCLLYLLDSMNIYVLQLSLQDSQIKTKACWIQLGVYVGRCIKKYGQFEKLDISGCILNQSQLQGFISGVCQGSMKNEFLIQELIAKRSLTYQDMILHQMLLAISLNLVIN